MPPTVRVYIIFDTVKFNKKKGTHRAGSCQSVLDLPLRAYMRFYCEEFTSTILITVFADAVWPKAAVGLFKRILESCYNISEYYWFIDGRGYAKTVIKSEVSRSPIMTPIAPEYLLRYIARRIMSVVVKGFFDDNLEAIKTFECKVFWNNACTSIQISIIHTTFRPRQTNFWLHYEKLTFIRTRFAKSWNHRHFRDAASLNDDYDSFNYCSKFKLNISSWKRVQCLPGIMSLDSITFSYNIQYGEATG